MIVVGIDPGLSGSVVRLAGDEVTHVWRGFKELSDISHAIVSAFDGGVLREPEKVAIEQVHAFAGQGVCSMFSFGKSTGVAFGTLYTCNSGVAAEIVEVSPQKWQNWYRAKFDLPKGAGTFDSCEVAKLVFPEAQIDMMRKKPRKKGEIGNVDHNVSDAALIAYWASSN